MLGVIVQKQSRLLNLASQGSESQMCEPGSTSTSSVLGIRICVMSLLVSRDLCETFWGLFIKFTISKMPTELSMSGEKYFNSV